MSQISVTQQGFLAFYTDWFAGEFAASSLRLFQNDVTPTRFSLATDFVECDFTGYNRLVASTRFIFALFNSMGATQWMSEITYGQVLNLIPQVVYGGYVVSTVNPGKLLVAFRFEEPFPIPSEPDYAFRDLGIWTFANLGAG